ncbi:transcription factor bHLH94-like [Andrographis paniculata]|uniref:transcription factor bHLH94-like n=1 Tax=Andrographis paniculata TaxID=175694 RepID=UPI0021E7857F|nr:transcription factor bHLH94-like [Andrographis paniculata]XP_051117960.1 transcription factor bHLH94-like [Andrographis paniculata]
MQSFFTYALPSRVSPALSRETLRRRRHRVNRESEEMALEAVVNCHQDPFTYALKDFNYAFSDFPAEDKPSAEILDAIGETGSSIGAWDSPPSSAVQNANSSPEDGFFAGGVYSQTATVASRRKRRRTKSLKNKEEMENQRMTHIAVERNRRRQMNDYLAVLRSLMPPSYAQRGDQASIVGGAINFVKELEQHLQFLESKRLGNEHNADNSDAFSNFFTFPQYSRRRSINSPVAGDATVERLSSVAEIEVTMVESHANIKILSKRRPKQVLKMVAGLQSVGLTILHLNITTVDQSLLCTFSVKVEDECQLSTVNEIATAVHDMVGVIQQDS